MVNEKRSGWNVFIHCHLAAMAIVKIELSFNLNILTRKKGSGAKCLVIFCVGGRGV
jgi:hypothetical protein